MIYRYMHGEQIASQTHEYFSNKRCPEVVMSARPWSRSTPDLVCPPLSPLFIAPFSGGHRPTVIEKKFGVNGKKKKSTWWIRPGGSNLRGYYTKNAT